MQIKQILAKRAEQLSNTSFLFTKTKHINNSYKAFPIKSFNRNKQETTNNECEAIEWNGDTTQIELSLTPNTPKCFQALYDGPIQYGFLVKESVEMGTSADSLRSAFASTYTETYIKSTTDKIHIFPLLIEQKEGALTYYSNLITKKTWSGTLQFSYDQYQFFNPQGFAVNIEGAFINLYGYKLNSEQIDCGNDECQSQYEDVVFLRAYGSSTSINIESKETTFPEKELAIKYSQLYTQNSEDQVKPEGCIEFNELFDPITIFNNEFSYSVKKDYEIKAIEEICITGARGYVGPLGFIIEGQNIQMGSSKGGTKIQNAYFSSYETTYILTDTTQKVTLYCINPSITNEGVGTIFSYLITYTNWEGSPKITEGSGGNLK